MIKEYDLIVIGAGGGAKIAGHARNNGLKVALIEKEAVGGTCLNRGCIPSKMLIHPANVIHHADEAKNIQVNSTSKVDFQKLVERVSYTVDKDASDSEKGYEKIPNQDFYKSHAKFVDDKTLEVDGQLITAKNIIIATGSRPLIPKIKGLEGIPYWTSREALRNKKLPKKLIIIGGGYIGCEIAHAYGTYGSEIHIVARSSLIQREDKDVYEAFTNVFKKRFNIHEGVKPVEVKYSNKIFEVKVEDSDGKSKTIKGDALLVATGVMPNSDQLGLEKSAVETNPRGFIKVDKHMETSVKGVYAIGDVVGNYMFRHSVNFEAEYLIEQLYESKIQNEIKYPPMPSAIFSYPEVAHVGYTEQELIRGGKEFVSVTHNYKNSAQGMARLPEVGFVKLLIDKKNKNVLGAHIIGDEASIMIHQILQGMHHKATVDDYLNIIYIHPALPEIVRNAFRKAKMKL